MSEDILPLLHKYDVPVPRYTSYPTVPYWEPDSLDAEKWKQAVVNTFKQENGELSIYIHLPFCESLCTFCACNKRITKNHKVEDPYLLAVLKEWALYVSMLPSQPVIREIHLGGGTPTFFSPEHLVMLINGITKDARIAPDHEFSIEVHPNYTTEEHLEALASVGFNRISLGVQDFDPVVQFIINRHQSFEKTREVLDWSRKHGYTSINIDLIYGLPKQTIESVRSTIKLIKELLPDRIAFYSYAHVPWKSKVQRRYTVEDLPTASEKLEMYQLGMNLLKELGFEAIGMDHFALQGDKLFSAASNGKMHRNFMGYTTTRTKLIVGLGCSSISDAWNAFAQNEKEVEKYQDKINEGKLPLVNGHLLNEEDVMIRQHILDMMCRNYTEIQEQAFDPAFYKNMLLKLAMLEDDGLITMENNKIAVTKRGALFIRSICSALDARLWHKQIGGNVFSKGI